MKSLLAQVEHFLKSTTTTLVFRHRIFVILGTSFFVSMLVFLTIATVESPIIIQVPEIPKQHGTGADWPETVWLIFEHNLLISSLYSAIPGVLFFPLSTIYPLYNAAIWGLYSYPLSPVQFLMVLPTLVLEGVGMVLAAMGGIIPGAAWLLPKKMYPGQALSRVKAFKIGLTEGAKIYTLSVVFFLVGAVVETATIISLPIS
jgi:hypothetical protein